MFSLRTTVVLAPLLLGGCVVAWGSSYHVDAQTPDGMTIQYDTTFIDEPEVQKMAIEYCQRAGKVARLQSRSRNMMNISTETFACQPKPVAVP